MCQMADLKTDIAAFERMRRELEASQGEQWHRVILGRSFLRHYQLAYDGFTGQVQITDPGGA